MRVYCGSQMSLCHLWFLEVQWKVCHFKGIHIRRGDLHAPLTGWPQRDLHGPYLQVNLRASSGHPSTRHTGTNLIRWHWEKKFFSMICRWFFNDLCLHLTKNMKVKLHLLGMMVGEIMFMNQMHNNHYEDRHTRDCFVEEKSAFVCLARIGCKTPQSYERSHTTRKEVFLF